MIYQHYLIGIDFGSTKYILHREKGNDKVTYSFKDRETTNGLLPVQTVRFQQQQNAKDLIKSLLTPETGTVLTDDVKEYLELLEPISTSTQINESRMMDYKL